MSESTTEKPDGTKRDTSVGRPLVDFEKDDSTKIPDIIYGRLGLHSQSLQCVAAEYVKARKQFKKSKLRWRKSRGPNRSLGWVPINTGAASWKNGQVLFNGHHFNVWDSYGLSKYRFRTASFNEDAQGRWYFNVVVSIEVPASKGTRAVGIDLGCKDAATVSSGVKLSGRWYREAKQTLATAQRARKPKRVKAIHAKVANRRKDALHKFSRALVGQNAAIFVGNVNAKAVARSRMGKSSLDAGWGMLKSMLEYKCTHAGVIFEVVDEKYTTQTCSKGAPSLVAHCLIRGREVSQGLE